MDHKCHYCEKQIETNQEWTALFNKKTEQKIFLHYPYCHVAFTTFYKTEKELAEWRKSIKARREAREDEAKEKQG